MSRARAPTPSATDKTLRNAAQLADAGLIARELAIPLQAVANRYAVAITPAVRAAMNPADPNDPVARQYVPSVQELTEHEAERSDPIGDDVHSPLPGLVHRYPDRVLLKASHVCPVYCRFCFRREVVGPQSPPPLADDALDAIANYLRDHPQIWEVILSGGDPLALSPRRLTAIVERLRPLMHIRVLRLHTRVPVVDPDRITDTLIDLLRGAAQTPWILIHANHPKEFTDAAVRAIARLADAGIPLRSQTVLLRGINDDEATLSALMRRFVELRIAPYYLHHPDLAPGTSHFAVSIPRGRELLRALQGNYSGLCQPEYVLDIPGGYGKAPVGPDYLHQDDATGVVVTDYQGRQHRYKDRTL
ncbi:MAG: lysine-2,3-aminomutase-like protein [Pseudomonadota bacterium]